jgi:hypothetical protein
VSDLERDGLQEVRSQGAEGLSVTRRAKINRRQFLTGAFRGRDVALSKTGVTSALPRDLAQGKLGDHHRFDWEDEPQIGRDFTAPETGPQDPGWDDGIDSVLEEMENLKGIEDF